MSEDGTEGLTIIAFIGSVFSPYYAWNRKRGSNDPFNHCAINVAIYSKKKNTWAMTERSHKALFRTASEFVVGSSNLEWSQGELCIDLDEFASPIPTKIRGRVRLIPDATFDTQFSLHPGDEHFWWPIAPIASVEVTMSNPAMSWSGHGYLDSNWGEAPLENTFRGWNWSRARKDAGAAITYDTVARDGLNRSLALEFEDSGHLNDFTHPGLVPLPGTLWRVPRLAPCDTGKTPLVRRSFEDTPFYTRSQVLTHISGMEVSAVHESLSLDRFRQRWVQLLLPFRMPRVWW